MFRIKYEQRYNVRCIFIVSQIWDLSHNNGFAFSISVGTSRRDLSIHTNCWVRIKYDLQTIASVYLVQVLRGFTWLCAI